MDVACCSETSLEAYENTVSLPKRQYLCNSAADAQTIKAAMGIGSIAVVSSVDIPYGRTDVAV
jgi:hypothetical protein